MMTEKSTPSVRAAQDSQTGVDLRKRAEAEHKGRADKNPDPLNDVDMLRLIHELQIHQIELEMQNEELRRSRAEVEGEKERYNELYQYEESLRNALAEKETLLRELYHRTKNNMQVIQAMLILQGNELKDSRARLVLQEIGAKIQGMAMVHEMLYRSRQLTNIDLRIYIQDLVALLHHQALSANQVSFSLELESQMVPIEVAIPCGLVLNELVTNALKHAFPDGNQGQIRVRFLRESDGRLLLEVSDNGIGLPAGFDFRQSDSLGLRTVTILAELQLEGEVDFRSPPGVTCQVRFNSDVVVE